ncbi:MAG: hypothetical protein JSV56_11510 [Methanomassiliicoccales archaeon]|nr:MAG: hypothetical protein JSV56_11510 [Methanomassiliicoccales archaeon]
MKTIKLCLGTLIVIMLMLAALPSASANLTLQGQVPDIVIDEDEVAENRLNLNDYFSSDNEQIHFSSVSLDNKIDVSIHEDGSVDFTAPKDWYGTEEVTVIASDGEQEVSETLIVTVEPINDPPLLLTPQSDLTFDEDYGLEGALNLNSHFQDIDSVLSYSYSSNSVLVTIDKDGSVDFSAPENWFGEEEVTFIASDGEFEVSDVVLVTVNPINDAPKSKVNLDSMDLNAATPSKTLLLEDYFEDVDDEVLTYEISGNVHIESKIDTQKGELILSAPEDWSGEEVITLSATDSSGKESSVQIVVLVARGSDSSGQIFYLFGLVLAVAIAGIRLQFSSRGRAVKSPVRLDSYRHYKGR